MASSRACFIRMSLMLGALLAAPSIGCDAEGGTTPRMFPDAGPGVDLGPDAPRPPPPPPEGCDRWTDSDGDGIADQVEGMGDTDGDGTQDLADDDSDDDGISDRDEGASGGNICVFPRNTDGDDFPDFKDRDSDNDGLSDEEETSSYGTDPLREDTDGDGFSDTAEVATGHDPLDAADGIPAEDFYVVLPYDGPEVVRQLTFGSNIRKADVFFLMDRTGSMNEESANLRSGLSSIVDRITMSIPDIGIGAGGFSDFAVACSDPSCCPFGICSPYGDTRDLPFELVGTITTDRTEAQGYVDDLHALQRGGAGYASSVEALFQTATGAGIVPFVPAQRCPSVLDEPAERYGYPCFRPGAQPIIVVLTDTASRNGPGATSPDIYFDADFPMERPHTYDQALSALTTIGARVFGVISGMEVGNPRTQFERWATDSGTVDSRGNPIFFMISPDGGGLGNAVAEAIEALAGDTPQNVSTATRDGEDIPAQPTEVDARLFIKRITPVEGFRMGIAGDGYTSKDDTTFYGVIPGTLLQFDVAFENDFQMPRSTAQIFRARIVVLGNGVAELDFRDVVIVVPAGSDIFFG